MSPDKRHALLEAALAYAGGTHTVEDVEALIASGEAQIWEGPNSLVVTEIDRQPRQAILLFFLAAGHKAELLAMQDGILAWGREQGCTRARLVGRRGWARSFLQDSGWADTQYVIMEREING